ncbi:MAG: ribonuclease HII [Rhodospirillales bacterium]
MPDFSLERALGVSPVAGIDEAGRGPLAGPVVAAAVVLDQARVPAGIDDAKTLTAAARARIAAELEACVSIGLGQASVAEIDRLDILRATMLAMRRALDALALALGRAPACALVDGNRLPELPCPARAVIRGDGKSLSIAAASIIAKVARDRMMAELAQAHPLYGWERNAGYGTAEHLRALTQHGATPHHRITFAPIHNLLIQR